MPKRKIKKANSFINNKLTFRLCPEQDLNLHEDTLTTP